MPDWYGNLNNLECQEGPLPYKWGNVVPWVADSWRVVEDMQSHTEAVAVKIASRVVSIVEAVHTLFVVQHPGNLGYRTAHRNLHLDYSDIHNWHKQGQQELLEHQVQS